ncbi:MAG: DUF167 domain-containing protein [Chloroflexi bacterium]|nr:DUF167 domain-containing protein [Chloroflexota bacterium]
MKIRVKVIPNSKTEEVAEEGDRFVVRVKEPAKEGKANRAVIKLVAAYFKVPQRQVVISSGFESRNKVIEVLEI